MFNAQVSKGYKDSPFIFAPKGYDMISPEIFKHKYKKYKPIPFVNIASKNPYCRL